LRRYVKDWGGDQQIYGHGQILTEAEQFVDCYLMAYLYHEKQGTYYFANV